METPVALPTQDALVHTWCPCSWPFASVTPVGACTGVKGDPAHLDVACGPSGQWEAHWLPMSSGHVSLREQRTPVLTRSTSGPPHGEIPVPANRSI